MPAKKHHGLPRGLVSQAQWRLFFSNPRLRQYADKEAHKAQAAGGGPVIAYHHLPKRKGIRKRV